MEQQTMLPLKDEDLSQSARISNPSAFVWFYFTAEFWIGGLLSIALTFLRHLKSLLPKPPRDLTGNVVLVAGATSSLGQSVVEAFAKNGCSLICLDNDAETLTTLTERLRSVGPRIEDVAPLHRKDAFRPRPRVTAYQCDLQSRGDVQRVAKFVKSEIGSLDVVVTCVGNAGQDVFDTVSSTLMSHYWTVLAFLPSLLRSEKAHVVGITPVASREDAYLSSKTAIASLMESLGKELTHHSSHITFMALSPITSDLTKESEESVAQEVIDAVKTDRVTFSNSWMSKCFYRIGCALHAVQASVAHWMQDHDYIT